MHILDIVDACLKNKCHGIRVIEPEASIEGFRFLESIINSDNQEKYLLLIIGELSDILVRIKGTYG